MTREIKFRLWDKACKEMVKDANRGWKIYLNGCVVDGDTWATGDVIIMQYTGLKDKNGKEIYEGDVVRYGKNTHCWCVKWDRYGWTLDDDVEFAEVVGNIYENPELLSNN